MGEKDTTELDPETINGLTYTLTYSPSVDGWPSFYSYYPDWMIGMNNYFYTFKGGNLYRHNVNPLRNTFYYEWWDAIGDRLGAFTNTSLTSVFNDIPLENKLFKTINLEGDAKWETDLYSDLQYTGFIQQAWFEKKEQAFFAFIRNSGTVPANMSEYALRSLNGIGRSINTTVSVGTTTIDFSISPLIAMDSILSVGDYVYFALPPLYDTPLFGGVVTNIIRNYPAGINRMIIDTTDPLVVPIIIVDPYFLYIKNSVAESHGILGHYCVFNLNNDSNDKVELFAVQSELMKSFP
jgi:hypothetical protein